MKCRAVRSWMLNDERPNRPPARVRRHLQHCEPCRQRFGRLVRLIHMVHQEPLPSGDCPAKAELLRRLPPPAVVPVSPLPRRWANRWTAVAAAVALVSLGVGWFLAAQRARTPEIPEQSLARSTAQPRRTLEDRVLEQHARLAEAEEPEEQLQALGQMAAALQTEALAAAARGEEDEVALLAWLHARLVGEGLLRCAAGVPESQRESLVAELRRLEIRAGRAAQAGSPRLAMSLRLLEASARDAAATLEGKPAQLPEPGPPPATGSRELLRVTVQQSLLVVGEDDPVRRARHATQVVDTLTHSLGNRAESADGEDVAWLGEALAALDRAVKSNLEQVGNDEPDEARKQAAEQVRKQVGAARQEFQRKLAQLPPAARERVQRALESKPQKPQFDKPRPKGPRKKDVPLKSRK